jgi:hypothetical protein
VYTSYVILHTPHTSLVESTQQTFKKIAEDALNGLYDYFFINFMKPISP